LRGPDVIVIDDVVPHTGSLSVRQCHVVDQL